MKVILSALALFLAACQPGSAVSSPRYQVVAGANGDVWRLDVQTGQMFICSRTERKQITDNVAVCLIAAEPSGADLFKY